MALEVVDGIPFIAAHVVSRKMCAKYANPPGSVLFFRWTGGQWEQTARESYPGNARMNLLLYPWGRTSAEDVSGFVGHKSKHTRPMNSMVNTAIDNRIANKALDTCEIAKTR